MATLEEMRKKKEEDSLAGAAAETVTTAVDEVSSLPGKAKEAANVVKYKGKGVGDIVSGVAGRYGARVADKFGAAKEALYSAPGSGKLGKVVGAAADLATEVVPATAAVKLGARRAGEATKDVGGGSATEAPKKQAGQMVASHTPTQAPASMTDSLSDKPSVREFMKSRGTSSGDSTVERTPGRTYTDNAEWRKNKDASDAAAATSEPIGARREVDSMASAKETLRVAGKRMDKSEADRKQRRADYLATHTKPVKSPEIKVEDFLQYSKGDDLSSKMANARRMYNHAMKREERQSAKAETVRKNKAAEELQQKQLGVSQQRADTAQYGARQRAADAAGKTAADQAKFELEQKKAADTAAYQKGQLDIAASGDERARVKMELEREYLDPGTSQERRDEILKLTGKYKEEKPTKSSIKSHKVSTGVIDPETGKMGTKTVFSRDGEFIDAPGGEPSTTRPSREGFEAEYAQVLKQFGGNEAKAREAMMKKYGKK